MKRSRHVSFAILGAAAFGLAACQEEPKTEASAFPDVQSCIAAATSDGWFSREDCEATFTEAQKLHEETAPRYESQALCEEEHGAGNCGSDQAAQSGGGGMGGIFLPLLAGYMMGQMMGGGRPMAQPLVNKPGGGFATPSGGTNVNRLNSTGPMATNAFNKAPTTVGQPPMTKSQVQSRGGFGSTAGARSSAGGSSAGG